MGRGRWYFIYAGVAAIAVQMKKANAGNQINQMLVNKSFEFIFIWPKPKC